MIPSKILVVEDEKCLRTLYKQDLEHEGYAVVTAEDAIAGRRALETAAPDFVVLDIRMPGVDGLDCMGRMLARNPRVPIVLNTAFCSYEDNFLSWADDAYGIKSADTGELRAKIRQVLQTRKIGHA